MAKTPTSRKPTLAPAAAPRTFSRSARASTPGSFVNENSDTEDEIQNGNEDSTMKNDGGSDGAESDGEKTLAMFVQKLQKYRDKKATGAQAEFEKQKKAVFATTRKVSKDMSKDGITHIEHIKDSIPQLKNKDSSYNDCAKALVSLWGVQDTCIGALVEHVVSTDEEIFFQHRSEQIEELSGMLREYDSSRDDSRAQYSANLYAQLAQSQEDKKTVTDASTLIKDYKKLLSNASTRRRVRA